MKLRNLHIVTSKTADTIETINNVLQKVNDIKKVIDFCKKNNIEISNCDCYD